MIANYKIITELDEQIKEIDRRIKLITKEIDHIKQFNELLISQIQEILDTSSFK
jgi:hypothetical protein